MIKGNSKVLATLTTMSYNIRLSFLPGCNKHVIKSYELRAPNKHENMKAIVIVSRDNKGKVLESHERKFPKGFEDKIV